jgi:hypothetical protein
MEIKPVRVPLEIQLEAACKLRLKETGDLMIRFDPGIRAWNRYAESFDSYREYIRGYFSFTPNELIEFLRVHPEICESLLQDSYDKRYSPSEFIEEWEDDQYRVGYFDQMGSPHSSQIHVFRSFAEATADYVLFSWGFSRLTREQATWHEMEHF